MIFIILFYYVIVLIFFFFSAKYVYPTGLTKVLNKSEIKFQITEETVMEVDA